MQEKSDQSGYKKVDLNYISSEQLNAQVIFENKKWLSTGEAAQYLGKTRNAIWILLSRGILLKRKWRRRLYFKRSELDQLLETSFT